MQTIELPSFNAQDTAIGNFDEIKEILASPSFHQRLSPEREIFLGGTVLALNGEAHQEKKKLFAPLFTKGAMVFYETQLLDPTIERVMVDLRSSHGDRKPVRTDLVPLIAHMLHRIAAQVAGLDGVDTPERTEGLRVRVAKFAECLHAHWSFLDKEQLVEEGREAVRGLADDYYRESLARRRELVARFKAGQIEQADLPKDVLTLIALHETEEMQNDPEHEAYIWRECTFFLQAATQTTTHTLPPMFVHLAEWFEAHPEDAGKKQDAAFLRLAVGETLRLHQSAPIRMRTAVADVTLSTGRQFRAGENVALFTPQANMDPERYGPDASSFNPYRKTPDPAQPWGLTFGGGAHLCMGRQLVTGIANRADPKTGTEGTAIKIAKALYAYGLDLDENAPPVRNTTSLHDTLVSVPIVLRNL